MKKLNLIIALALTILTLKSKGQATYDWALNFGGTVNVSTQQDDARTVKTDNSGNVYIGGTFYGTTDFDPGPGTQIRTSAGSGDGYIAKYDANGNFLAVYTFSNNLDCRLIAIDIDNLGNIVATGHFEGTVDFDPTAGFYGLSSPSGYDFFVLKLNANGTFAWAVKIGAASVNDLGIAISADLNNSVLVTGQFNGTTDFDPGLGVTNLTSTTGGDAYLLKLSSAGVFSWAINIGNSPSSNDRGLCIHCDAIGNAIVGGIFQGTCDFDPSPATNTLVSTGIQSGFIAQYGSALGGFMFAKKFDGTGISTINDFNLNPSGDIFVAGTFTGSIDADPGAGVSIISTGTTVNTDLFVVKLNASGNFVWANKIGGAIDDGATGITSDASGVYFSGFFSGIVDFDSGPGTYTLNSNLARDFFISKIDLNGGHIYSYSAGDPTSNDIAYAITTPSVNTIYIAGSFFGSVDFNPSPYAVNTLTSNGGNDAFLLKLKSCNQTPSLTASSTSICSGASTSLTATGSNTVIWNTSATSSVIVVTPTATTNYSVTANFTTGCVGTSTIDIQVANCTGVYENVNTPSEFLIYPNPSNGVFYLNTQEFGIYNIINTLGEIVKTIEIREAATKLNLKDLSTGIYYFNHKQTSKKIIIN